MYNLTDNFNKILVIVKEKLINHIDQHGNIHRRGSKPKFSYVETIALNLTAECLMIDSENHLFKLLNNQKHFFSNLIDRSNYNRRKKNLFKHEMVKRRHGRGILRPLDGQVGFCNSSSPNTDYERDNDHEHDLVVEGGNPLVRYYEKESGLNDIF